MLNQSHTGSGDNVGRDKNIINVNIKNNKKIPKILSNQNGIFINNFVGREKELNEIDKLLNEEKALLIQGIGGIGKSLLVSKYLNLSQDKYSHIAFIECSENLKNSFVACFSDKLKTDDTTIDNIFNGILHFMHNLEGKKLLILDDVQNNNDNKEVLKQILSLCNSDFHIILTSRKKIENIRIYQLSEMSKEESLVLFKKYYFFKEDEKKEILQILKFIDYHPLIIELTAKTLNRKKALGPKKLIDKFETGELPKIKINREKSFNDYLLTLFKDDSILKDNELLLILKKLSVLPSIEITFEKLIKLFNINNVNEEEVEYFEELLLDLVEKGWLIQTQNGYKFHQILKEFILENFDINLDEIKSIINYYVNIISNLNTISDVLEIKDEIIFLESLIFSLDKKYINNTNDDIAYIYHGLGYIYDIFGKIYKSKKFYEKALIIRKTILPENHILFAISYGGLGSIYEKYGEFEKALEYYLKSLKVRESWFKNISNDNKKLVKEKLAIAYNNVGRMYELTGNLVEAEKFLEKSLKLREEIFGEKDEKTARAYNVMGRFYMTKYLKTEKDFYKEKSLKYLKKSLNIRKEILDKNHPDIARSYNSLGVFYISVGEIISAVNCFKAVINNFNNNEHLEILSESYANLGVSYYLLKNKQYAIENIEKAIDLWKQIYNDENHKFIIKHKELLQKIKQEL